MMWRNCWYWFRLEPCRFKEFRQFKIFREIPDLTFRTTACEAGQGLSPFRLKRLSASGAFAKEPAFVPIGNLAHWQSSR